MLIKLNSLQFSSEDHFKKTKFSANFPHSLNLQYENASYRMQLPEGPNKDERKPHSPCLYVPQTSADKKYHLHSYWSMIGHVTSHLQSDWLMFAHVTNVHFFDTYQEQIRCISYQNSISPPPSDYHNTTCCLRDLILVKLSYFRYFTILRLFQQNFPRCFD